MSKTKMILPSDNLPSYLKGAAHVGGGLQDETQILSPPRLKLLQSQNPEVAEGKGKIGEYYSDAHCRSFGPELHLIPIRFDLEWLEFYSDDEDGEGVKWRASDPNDPKVLACGEDAWRFKRLNMLCIDPIGVDGVTPKAEVLSFHGFSMAPGKSMYQEALHGVDAPHQSQVWKFTVKTTPGKNKSTIQVIVPRRVGFADEALFSQAKSVFKEFADRELVPEYEVAVKDGGTKGTGKASEEEGDLPF
jgi:hypothetical protein